MFLADLRPYELASACIGYEIVLLFEVRDTYEINAYRPLANALQLGPTTATRSAANISCKSIDA